MKKLLLLLFVFPILVNSQNTVCFTIDPNPNTNDPALAPFTKYVDVLGCFSIYAESTISDAKFYMQQQLLPNYWTIMKME